MHLIQLLLPLYDNDGNRIARREFEDARRTLTERFGGVTAYLRAPAEGDWKESDDSTARDEIVIFEVMVDALDRAWWNEYRESLRERFRQDELVVRALPIERL